MDFQLNEAEVRVLGSLVEKESHHARTITRSR